MIRRPLFMTKRWSKLLSIPCIIGYISYLNYKNECQVSVIKEVLQFKFLIQTMCAEYHFNLIKGMKTDVQNYLKVASNTRHGCNSFTLVLVSTYDHKTRTKFMRWMIFFTFWIRFYFIKWLYSWLSRDILPICNHDGQHCSDYSQ